MGGGGGGEEGEVGGRSVEDSFWGLENEMMDGNGRWVWCVDRRFNIEILSEKWLPRCGYEDRGITS